MIGSAPFRFDIQQNLQIKVLTSLKGKKKNQFHKFFFRRAQKFNLFEQAIQVNPKQTKCLCVSQQCNKKKLANQIQNKSNFQMSKLHISNKYVL